MTVIQKLKKEIKDNYDNLSAEGKSFANRFFLAESSLLLIDEKEQIIEAYNAGREYGCKYDDPEDGEEYYNRIVNKA